jgi:hypothetical protein
MQRFLTIVLILGGAAAVGPRSSHADITSNLVAWYKLDATTGSTATDSSGGGHDATFPVTPTWTAGKIGNAAKFGNSSRLVTPSVLSVATPFSASVWAKAGSATSVIMTWGSGNSGDLTWGSGGTGLVETDNDSASYFAANDGGFHHFVVTDDLTTTRLYVDGVLKQSIDSVSTLGTIVQIGANVNESVDEIRVFQRKLSDGGVSIGQTVGGDIAELYQSWHRMLSRAQAADGSRIPLTSIEE